MIRKRNSKMTWNSVERILFASVFLIGQISCQPDRHPVDSDTHTHSDHFPSLSNIINNAIAASIKSMENDPIVYPTDKAEMNGGNFRTTTSSIAT